MTVTYKRIFIHECSTQAEYDEIKDSTGFPACATTTLDDPNLKITVELAEMTLEKVNGQWVAT